VSGAAQDPFSVGGVECLLPRRADTSGVLVGSGVHRFEFPRAEEATETTSLNTQTAKEREVLVSCFGYFSLVRQLSASARSKSMFTADRASQRFPYLERASERCSFSPAELAWAFLPLAWCVVEILLFRIYPSHVE